MLYVPLIATDSSLVARLSVTPLLRSTVLICRVVGVFAKVVWAELTPMPELCVVFDVPAAPRVQPVNDVDVIPV